MLWIIQMRNAAALTGKSVARALNRQVRRRIGCIVDLRIILVMLFKEGKEFAL